MCHSTGRSAIRLKHKEHSRRCVKQHDRASRLAVFVLQTDTSVVTLMLHRSSPASETRACLQVACEGTVVGIGSCLVVLSDSQRAEHLLGVVSCILTEYQLWICKTWQTRSHSHA